MDSKTKWLIGGFIYMLGVMGLFIVTFFDVRDYTGSDVRAVEEALIAGILWPIEIIRLIFKIF